MNENESYSKQAILPISEILPFVPFENHLRFFDIPAVRLIGKSTKDALNSNPNPIPAFWSEYFAKGYDLVTEALPHVIPNRLAAFFDFSSETNQYTYMICVACPADTLVPDGFEFRDMPASVVCHGVTNEKEADPYSEEKVREELKKLGFTLLGPVYEFYPDPEKPNFCVLFTCSQMEQ